MMPEVSLMAVLVIVFIADFFTAPRVADVQAGTDFKAPRAWFGPLVCVLMLAHTLLNLAPVESAVTFGGMYYTTPSIGIIKSILAFGTLIVLIQSREWMRRPRYLLQGGRVLHAHPRYPLGYEHDGKCQPLPAVLPGS